MIRELVPSSSNALTTKTVEFDFANPFMDAQELVQQLKDTMCYHKGVGLSANQIGLPYRVFVMGNPSDPDNIIPVFNPVLVSTEDDLVWFEEGCLSFPGLFVKIKRPNTIRVRYANVEGNTDTIKFSGMTARIFQHEYDHMEGVIHKSRAHPYHLEQALRNKKKYDRQRAKNQEELNI